MDLWGWNIEWGGPSAANAGIIYSINGRSGSLTQGGLLLDPLVQISFNGRSHSGQFLATRAWCEEPSVRSGWKAKSSRFRSPMGVVQFSEKRPPISAPDCGATQEGHSLGNQLLAKALLQKLPRRKDRSSLVLLLDLQGSWNK